MTNLKGPLLTTVLVCPVDALTTLPEVTTFPAGTKSDAFLPSTVPAFTAFWALTAFVALTAFWAFVAFVAVGTPAWIALSASFAFLFAFLAFLFAFLAVLSAFLASLPGDAPSAGIATAKTATITSPSSTYLRRMWTSLVRGLRVSGRPYPASGWRRLRGRWLWISSACCQVGRLIQWISGS